MKYFIILSIILFINVNAKAQEKTIIDTLRVSVLDTAFFLKLPVKPHYSPVSIFLKTQYYYLLVERKNAYYIISNERERTVTEKLCVKGNCDIKKISWYTKSARLKGVRFYEKSSSRIETYNRKGVPKKISYFDDKGNLKKDEFYTNGKLKKIRSYIRFNKYTTEYIK